MKARVEELEANRCELAVARADIERYKAREADFGRSERERANMEEELAMLRAATHAMQAEKSGMEQAAQHLHSLTVKQAARIA
jgi:flagellar basal body rod protein FlgB